MLFCPVVYGFLSESFFSSVVYLLFVHKQFMYASWPMANPHRNELPIYMCSQLNKQKEGGGIVHTCLSKKFRSCTFSLLLQGA